MKTFAITLVPLVMIACGVAPADAGVTYGFTNITHRSDTNAAIGEAQMSVTAFNAGSDSFGNLYTGFQFDNTGPAASSMTDLYFDDSGDLFHSQMWIDDSDSGVSFSQFARPDNLPGGGSVGFSTSPGLSADSDRPVRRSGVNPGETLGIYLALAGGFDFNDVISALSDSSLRIGVQLKGFSEGGRESYVNNTPDTPVAPEPSSIAILSLGMLGFVGLRRRKRRMQLEANDA